MSEWQPIETAPKDGTTIPVIWDGVVRFARFDLRGGPFDDNGMLTPGWVFVAYDGKPRARAFEPTHWLPLPEPPK